MFTHLKLGRGSEIQLQVSENLNYFSNWAAVSFADQCWGALILEQ